MAGACKDMSQLTFNGSKSVIETLEKSVKNFQTNKSEQRRVFLRNLLENTPKLKILQKLITNFYINLVGTITKNLKRFNYSFYRNKCVRLTFANIVKILHRESIVVLDLATGYFSIFCGKDGKTTLKFLHLAQTHQFHS